MEAQTRCHCGFKYERPPKGAKQSPDVRRKGVGRANLTAPKLFEDMLKVNYSDGERNMFDAESHDVCRWGRRLFRHLGGLPVRFLQRLVEGQTVVYVCMSTKNGSCFEIGCVRK